jgi:MscS family membrane protein
MFQAARGSLRYNEFLVSSNLWMRGVACSNASLILWGNSMTSMRIRAMLLVGLAATLSAGAQNLPAPVKKAPAGLQALAANDSFGRETPAGTIFGFLQTAQAGNYKAAAQYLKMSAAERQAKGEDLAVKLKIVMDRAFVGSLKNISNDPDGSLQPGIPPDQQRIGSLVAGEMEADLVLVRVNDPINGRIWLISPQTVEKVDELYDQLQARQIEKRIPQALVRNSLLGMPLWQWLAMLLAVPCVALAAWLLVQFISVPQRLWAHYRHQVQLKSWTAISGPLWLLLGIVLHGVAVSYLKLPLLQRHYYYGTATVVLIVAVTWLALRIGNRIMRHLRDRALSYGKTGTGSLILLGQRILKVVIIIVAALFVLGSLGFNLTTALAGLGIGGLAIAFAAQKTLENLFGGVSLLGDEVLRVGDVCRVSDRVGTVEDISLRSTRIRTVERTELSIPNGSLATMNLENLTRRDKILFTGKVSLRYETVPEQLRYVLAEVRRMLYEHPKVDAGSARVRLAELATSSIDLEIFCYVLTTDHSEFTAIREDLLLRIMDIVGESGTGFALPAHTVYMAQDRGVDQAKTEAAVEKVQRWRDEKHLPFPDFAPADISSFRGSIAYPHPDSAVGNTRPK